MKITAPDGSAVTEKAVIDSRRTSVHIDISDPKLWYPRGYGEQPLYKLSVTLLDGENTADKYECEIGLRTVTVSTAPDEYGEEFAFVVNGLKIFAMGANYIPENQIIPKCSPQNRETFKAVLPCKLQHDTCLGRRILSRRQLLFRLRQNGSAGMAGLYVRLLGI